MTWLRARELRDKSPRLFGVPTGTRLDEMFYKLEEENGNFVKKPLGGLPYLGVINVVGLPDTGKSVLAQQFAVQQVKNGYKVLFVTVEAPANFLYASLVQKAKVMGVDKADVEERIAIIDVSMNENLRNNVSALLGVMKNAIREFGATVTIIDSVTGLYEHKESTARQIVRSVYNFLKAYRQTAMLISQKRSSQDTGSAEAAGGLAVAHIVDGTIVMDKKIIETKWDRSLYKLPLGSVLRTIRIDGCRLCPHDSRTWVFDIDERGLINVRVTLSDFVAEGVE